MVRAGLLSNPAVIELLNRYFVPVVMDVKDEHLPPAEQHLYLRAKFSRKLLEGHVPAKRYRDLQTAIVILILNADGVCVDGINPVRQPLEAAAVLQGVVTRLHPMPAARPHTFVRRQVGAPGDLQLTLNARFLKTFPDGTPLQLPHHPPTAYVGDHFATLASPEDLLALRLRCPTADHLVLSADQWRQLVPPAQTAVGASWTVSQPVCKALLHLVRPPTHNCHPHSDEVQSAALTATLASRHGADVAVRLQGSVKVDQPWFPTAREQVNLSGIALNARGRDKHWAEASLVGWLHYDMASDRVKSFQVTTVRALYQDASGTRMPFACVLYRP